MSKATEEAVEAIRLSVIDYWCPSGVHGDAWEEEKIRPIISQAIRSVLEEAEDSMDGLVKHEIGQSEYVSLAGVRRKFRTAIEKTEEKK